MKLTLPSSMRKDIDKLLSIEEENEAQLIKKVKELPYEHIPGTTHINAYIEDVEKAWHTVNEAWANLKTAEQRLYDKKVESGMIKK